MWQLSLWGGFAKQRKACLAQSNFELPELSRELENQLNQDLETSSGLALISNRAEVWLGMARSARTLFLYSICYSLASSLSMLISVVCAQKLLARPSSINTLAGLSFGFLLFQVLNVLFTYRANLVRAQVQSTVRLSLLNAVNRKLLKRDYHRMSGFSSGMLKTLVSSDVQDVPIFVDNFLLNGTPFLVSLFVYIPAIVWNMGVPGIWGVGAALLQIPMAMFTGKFVGYFHATVQQNRDENTNLLGEWIRNIRLIRALSWQPVFLREIAQNVREVVKAGAWEHLFTCLMFGFSFCWWMLPIATLVLASHFLNSTVPLSQMFASVWILNQLSSGMQHIPDTFTKFASANVSLKRIVSLLKTPDLQYDSAKNNNLNYAKFGKVTEVELNNVTLIYHTAEVISNLSLKISFTQKTALVGQVGSGKTTLLRILLGELRPTSGAVNVVFENGQRANLWEEKIARLYTSQIGSAPQEPFLSNTTLANNISLDLGTSGQEVARAIELAELQADLEALPHGYNEEVGELGVTLSGGQKQRLSIARAFYSDRSFLFLDDPLSAVDSQTEKSLMQAFLKHLSGFVMASHRLGELNLVDRILVIEGGKILEDAAPEVLLSNPSSRYKEFLES